MTDIISLLVVDDHAMVRDALAERFRSTPDIRVVGEAENAAVAIDEAMRLTPALVLMDIDMPGLVCFDAARTIRKNVPQTRVAFLSAFFNDRYIEEALAVHAVGYLTKGESLETIVGAIRTMASGRTYFSPDVQARLVLDDDGMRLQSSRHARASTLTQRELEILRYLARGMAKKEIAQTVHISEGTVHGHAANIMKKLDIHDRVALARYAIREGLSEA